MKRLFTLTHWNKNQNIITKTSHRKGLFNRSTGDVSEIPVPLKYWQTLSRTVFSVEPGVSISSSRTHRSPRPSASVPLTWWFKHTTVTLDERLTRVWTQTLIPEVQADPQRSRHLTDSTLEPLNLQALLPEHRQTEIIMLSSLKQHVSADVHHLCQYLCVSVERVCEGVIEAVLQQSLL